MIVQWLLETPPWDFQELCARYKYRENKHVRRHVKNIHFFALFIDRSIFKVIALKEAMNNQEEPSALQLINDEENAELMFLLDAFNYQPADRPASRTLEEKLAMVSRTPTWTNIAYNKYFNQ